MRRIELSEETFRKLVELKNHWSFQHRRVTNKEVLRLLDEAKRRIFGYGNDASPEEIMEISRRKTRAELEEEAERFSKVYRELLVSGYDFEPEYTFDMHIRKMIEAINRGDAGYPY